jgi:hypothetical protein
MTRPTTQIDKPNQIKTLLAHLHDNLPAFSTLSGVIGITLNGGLARGYGDHLSEIDITFYLESKTYTDWQHGNAPIGVGIQRLNGALYDIKIVDFAQEDVESWSTDARWDASYAQILHDPTDGIGKLLEENLQHRPAPSDADGVMFSAWWHFRLAGDIWIYRDDPLQAHFILNQAVTELVKAVYIANKEFIPHEKWLIHMSRTLQWTPDNWITRLTQIICDLSPDIQNVEVRQRHIATLWDEIDRYITSTMGDQYPLKVMHKTFYELLMMLIENISVSTDKWKDIADLSLLNHAPFNLCVSVHEKSITLDHAKCIALSPDDLYAWHYDIVKAVRSHLP